MTEISTLSAMAEAATIAGTLMPDNPTPGHFDTWAEFRTAFEGVDHLLFASIQEKLEAIRPRAPFVDEVDASLPNGEAWVVDAVDGAIQYLQGLPQWSVSIALVRTANQNWRRYTVHSSARSTPQRGAAVPSATASPWHHPARPIWVSRSSARANRHSPLANPLPLRPRAVR